MIIFYVLYINNSYDFSWQLLMYLLIVMFSITVLQYGDTFYLGSFYVHGFDDFTDTWLHSCTSRVLLMACVWVYNKMITQKNFAMSKFFPWQARMQNYILHIFGLRLSWRLEQSYYHINDDPVRTTSLCYGPCNGTSLKLLWWFIEGVSYEPLIRNTTFFLQDL